MILVAEITEAEAAEFNAEWDLTATPAELIRCTNPDCACVGLPGQDFTSASNSLSGAQFAAVCVACGAEQD